VLLAGIMLKMGTYGFVRIAIPFLPDGAEAYAPWIGALAAIAIVYAALACLAQKDLKRLIAFSSVGHMGFVMLGISSLTDRGINGAMLGMVVHGLITGMLFFLAGSVHERYHTRDISRLGGMALQLPWLAFTLAFSAIASLGLPGLAGFWGEFLALLGAYNPATVLADTTVFYRVLTALGVVGTLLTAGYFLWLLQRVNLGRIKDEFAGHAFKDVTPTEWIAWAPLLALIVVVGVWPRLLLDVTTGAVQVVAQAFGG
jgi:NADH-quinone oxidoreductase subunit M